VFLLTGAIGTWVTGAIGTWVSHVQLPQNAGITNTMN